MATELRSLGRYNVEGVLGRGAMGVVYAGLDPRLQRRVAIKTIDKRHVQGRGADEYSALFLREAQAAARLSHPHIVQVHDFGEEAEVAYLVMEFIAGRELKSFFDARHRFPLGETVRLMGELCQALDYAHRAGVIHRDVKPANVMLDADLRVKLADFGVARLQDPQGTAQGSTMIGTPGYMSPEQMAGKPVDARSDVFSAGVVLYELLTGERPVLMLGDPQPPSSLVPALSPLFDAVAARALAREPAQRYPSARALGKALEDCLRADGMMTDVPVREVPGRKRSFGELRVKRGDAPSLLPLQSVEIAAKVSGFVAEVTLRQKFANPHGEHLEAEYVFPLAGGCAVGRFELHVAGRVVLGKVEERGEARRQYAQAMKEGKRAALLEQERANVFTVRVGNLPPGEDATVVLTYSERLDFFDDGASELRLPLVVAPRYSSGNVPDAAAISPPRLPQGFDPLVALKIEVELSGGDFDELLCTQHATRTGLRGGAIRVQLARAERLDRDFVLRWRMGGEAITSRLHVLPAEDGASYCALTLVPPRRDGKLELPRDVVFVLDRSGSMGEDKMTSAARACALLLRTLGPRDRFAIQAFDDRVEWLHEGERRFFAADEEGVQKGALHLRGIGSRGGTELDGALASAIAIFSDPAEASPEGEGQPIVVLLTDGQVGDEASVLKRLAARLSKARVFAVGIDTAVNDEFLRRIASISGGTSAFVTPGAALEDALQAMAREIGSPLVTDLRIEDPEGGLDAASLTPMRLPELFAGRAATVFLRLKGSGSLRVSGRFTDGARFEARVTAEPVALPALAHLWARSRVTDLEDRWRMSGTRMPLVAGDTQEALKAEIVELACAHMLLTPFTAFVAVDQEVVNEGGERLRIAQPVESPAGWDAAPDIGAYEVGALLSSTDDLGGVEHLTLGSSRSPGSATTGDMGEIEVEFWRAIKDGNDPDDFELYLQQFPNGIYVALAKRKLAKLKGGTPPGAAATPQELEEIARREAEVSAHREAEKQKLEAELARREAERLEAEAKKMRDPAWVRKVLDEIEAALARLEQALAAGRDPSVPKLEHWIQQLALVLRHSPAAAGMPLLQRFAEQAPDLIDALRVGDIFEIRRQAKAQLPAFRAARAEALASL